MTIRAIPLAAAVLLLAGCATPTPVPPDATEADADRYVAEQLVQYWSALGPAQANGRIVADRIAFTTAESWASQQVTCLVAAGLGAREVSGGFAIDSNGSLSNAEGIDAQLTCLAQYPVDPRTQGLLSDAQVLYMYDYFTERLGPCLDLLGYTVSRAPARTAFLQAVYEPEPWTPYRDIAPGADWRLINAECPPLPVDPFAAFQPPVTG